MMAIEVGNPMVTDWWDEHEYRVPIKARMKRERQAYEEVEREGFGNEGSCNRNHPGTGQDIL